jgi:hypothetical protein
MSRAKVQVVKVRMEKPRPRPPLVVRAVVHEPVFISPGLKQRMERLAQARSRTLDEEVQTALERYLSQEAPPPPAEPSGEKRSRRKKGGN